MTDTHICPVCGKTTFSKKNSYEIWDYCWWQDCELQEEDPDLAGCANHMSLNQARQAYFSKTRKMAMA